MSVNLFIRGANIAMAVAFLIMFVSLFFGYEPSRAVIGFTFLICVMHYITIAIIGGD